MKSKVILMCGPAGSGKSTVAKKLKNKGMTILSYDEESFKRGIIHHPLLESIRQEIQKILDEKMTTLILEKKDIVLDYSFWSKEMRINYILKLKKYGIEPIIYYVKTPKEICLARIRNRTGKQPNEILLTEALASKYYDQFQPPSPEEAVVIEIKGF